MALLDAHLGSLLVALAFLAVFLGIAAQVLAVRLLANAGDAANDPVFRKSHRLRRPAAERRPYLCAATRGFS